MPKHTITTTFAAALLGATPVIAVPGPAHAETRHIVVLAVEPRGGAIVDKEPFPTEAMQAGPGYVLKQPDQAGRWEISAYVFMPSQIVINQDDDVTLEFVGINGAQHPITIADLKRGQVTKISFKADKAGVFAIRCATHQPSMVGELVVLPRK
jgi:plastocyanin